MSCIGPDGKDLFSGSQIVMPGDTKPLICRKNKPHFGILPKEDLTKELLKIEKEREEFFAVYGNSFF